MTKNTKENKTKEYKAKEMMLGDIPIRIVRSRRKTMGITVDEEALVTLRIPMRASEQQAMEFAKEKSGWILSKVKLQKERIKQRRLQEQELEKQYTPEQRQELKKRYVKVAHTYIPRRCNYYADMLGVNYNRIRIAEQKTRWGSCSCNRTLSYNWKLMLAPPQVLDYVVVHELCHLIEMNHSPRFWALVESVMPDYKEHRKWLKENGDSLQL